MALELALKLPREARAGIARAATTHATGDGAGSFQQINWEQMEDSMARIRRGFDSADAHLAEAEKAEGIQLLLCPSCWEVDWNDDGVIDADDSLWTIDFDENGAPIDRGAARSNPVFRFDVGDVAWLRAMISFQAAIASLVRAYDWSELPELVHGAERVTLRLVDAEAVGEAERHIRAGLAHSARSRTAYLAEDDDYLEWLPSPEQTSSAYPGTLSAGGYDAWSTALVELEQIVGGDTSVPVEPLVYVLSETAWEPGTSRRAIDLGGFLDEPTDIVIDLQLVERIAESRRIDDLVALASARRLRLSAAAHSINSRPSPSSSRRHALSGASPRRAHFGRSGHPPDSLAPTRPKLASAPARVS